jgi:hypothetical protein
MTITNARGKDRINALGRLDEWTADASLGYAVYDPKDYLVCTCLAPTFASWAYR